MIFDFHCHTTCSDGALSPNEIVSLAAKNQVRYLSITDHDTVAAYEQLQDQPLPENLTLIPGIELSSQYRNRGVHILGLNINPRHPKMIEACITQDKNRSERAEKIAFKLEKMGFGSQEITLAKVRHLANSDIVGRPHFAQFLVHEGHFSSIDQAFRKALGDNKPAFVRQDWPELEQTVDWITASGGIAAIAHPDKYGMTRRKLGRFIEAFKVVGGQGFEVLCARQTPDITQKLISLAQEHNMLASMGSDFHAPSQTWLKLGMHPALPKGCQNILEAILSS